VRDHLLSEQIDQEQRGVAFWAVPAQADGAAKELVYMDTIDLFVERLSFTD
jgi:hypothetical protein